LTLSILRAGRANAKAQGIQRPSAAGGFSGTSPRPHNQPLITFLEESIKPVSRQLSSIKCLQKPSIFSTTCLKSCRLRYSNTLSTSCINDRPIPFPLPATTTKRLSTHSSQIPTSSCPIPPLLKDCLNEISFWDTYAGDSDDLRNRRRPETISLNWR